MTETRTNSSCAGLGHGFGASGRNPQNGKLNAQSETFSNGRKVERKPCQLFFFSNLRTLSRLMGRGLSLRGSPALRIAPVRVGGRIYKGRASASAGGSEELGGGRGGRGARGGRGGRGGRLRRLRWSKKNPPCRAPGAAGGRQKRGRRCAAPGARPLRGECTDDRDRASTEREVRQPRAGLRGPET